MKRIHTVRSVRNHPIPHTFSSSAIAAPVISKRARSFRFKGFASLSSQQESAHIMDEAENLETGDVMCHSFGHEYATRCKDEGFGVIHSTKQSEKDDTRESQLGSNIETKERNSSEGGKSAAPNKQVAHKPEHPA